MASQPLPRQRLPATLLAPPRPAADTSVRPSEPIAAPAARRIARRRTSPGDRWLLLLLLALALLSRIYSVNSLAGEPTSDEYLYGIHARDLARDWAAGQPFSLVGLTDEGRLVTAQAAVASLVIPWDAITVGRTLEALLNALCIPMTFALGRRLGMPAGAALAGAFLLLGVPEFQEEAWRFWTDSQATLFALGYLTALVGYVMRPTLLTALAALCSLAVLVFTKESVAVAYAPYLLALVLPVARKSRRLALVTGAATLLLAMVVAILVATDAGVYRELVRNPLLLRTFGVAPLAFHALRDAVPQVPSYVHEVRDQLSPVQLSVGFLWAFVLGCLTLPVYALGVASTPRLALRLTLAWTVAALAWLPTLLIIAPTLNALQAPDVWWSLTVAVFVAILGAAAGMRPREASAGRWAFAFLGVVVLGFVLERMLVLAAPKVGSSAALTFRSFMPIVPLLALLAGSGVWRACSAGRLLLPAWRASRTTATLLAVLLLVGVWSPVVRQRLTAHPLLGRTADRGADAETPQGLRVQALVEAEGWLRANVRSTDVTITGIPRHLAWYADMDVDGLEGLVDLGAQARSPQERREYIQERIGPEGASYVVDFNVDWLDPAGERSREWRQTFEWLAAQPHLEVAYLRRDRFGNPVLYVIRNHGYAYPPSR